jgi:hypothetical protein
MDGVRLGSITHACRKDTFFADFDQLSRPRSTGRTQRSSEICRDSPHAEPSQLPGDVMAVTPQPPGRARS